MGVGKGAGPGEEIFTASRWTSGNRLFPTTIAVSAERVTRIKRRLFGSDEESIALAKVASVKISKGLWFADICIESSGGTDPIQSHGHRKRDAERIGELVESHQARDNGRAAREPAHSRP